MSEDQTNKPRSAPWHLWLVGGLGFLWNAMGAFDYLMTQTRNEGYMGQFTPEQLEFFYGFPSWVVAFWALAVWGGVLGTLLLLFRKKLAVWVFLISFASMVVTTIRNYVFAEGMEVTGGVGTLVFTALIFLFGLGFWLYAAAMDKWGVLR